MKKEVFFGIFLVLALSIASGFNSEKISKNILSDLSEKEEIDIYIKYSDNKFQHKSISSDQYMGSVDVKYFNSEEAYLRANKEYIEKLLLNENVEKIELEGIRHLFLQDSVSLVNASPTHSLVENVNLTGEGQTVCILDSGINYTHPDLGGCFGEGCKVIGGYDFVNSDTDPMDDNGHGTHVAGIVAANGSIKGVAPGANIVAVKVCNSAGSCSDSDISKGINWCIGNSSNYNISVISMSLGAGLYSDYCNSDPLADEINDAVDNNLSVVISSGNGLNNVGPGNATAISAPACVESAIAVSATTKSDEIDTSYADRNFIVKLLAPGTSINSTHLSPTGYAKSSGTSMAAPHVSGAIAILNQYLNLTQRKKNSSELELTLNETGRQIVDSETNISYSRINIYDAVVSLDSDPPNVSLISPINNLINISQNQTFKCNATDLSLKNVTFYLWNSSSDEINTSFSEVSGGFNEFETIVTNISFGSYKWNCLYKDRNGNSAFAVSNYSLTVGGINVELLSPLNNNHTNRQNVTYSCSARSEEEYSLTNITFYLWNSSSLIFNESKDLVGSNNESEFNYTFEYDEDYKWNCLAFNNNTNSTFASLNHSISYDSESPNISSVSPLDGQSYTGETNVLFEYNVTNNYRVSSCNLILNGADSASNSTGIVNGTNNISYSVSPGSHSWSVNCTDLAGNIGVSEERTLTINSISTSSSSSGGGGGGGGSSLATVPEVNSNNEKEDNETVDENNAFGDEPLEREAEDVNKTTTNETEKDGEIKEFLDKSVDRVLSWDFAVIAVLVIFFYLLGRFVSFKKKEGRGKNRKRNNKQSDNEE